MNFNFKKLFLALLVMIASNTQAGWGWHAFCDKATSFLTNNRPSVQLSVALIVGALAARLAAKYIYNQNSNYQELSAVVFKNHYAARPYSKAIFSRNTSYAHTEKYSLSIELDSNNKHNLSIFKKDQFIKLLSNCENIYVFYKNDQLVVLCDYCNGSLLLFEYVDSKLVRIADVTSPKKIKVEDVEKIKLFKNKLVLVGKETDDIYPKLFSSYEDLEEKLDIKNINMSDKR